MTPRAIEILRSVDVIAAEDTRNTMKLLQVFDIHTRMIAHHSHNERESAKGLLNLLEQGQSVAVVSGRRISVDLRSRPEYRPNK